MDAVDKANAVDNAAVENHAAEVDAASRKLTEQEDQEQLAVTEAAIGLGSRSAGKPNDEKAPVDSRKPSAAIDIHHMKNTTPRTGDGLPPMGGEPAGVAMKEQNDMGIHHQEAAASQIGADGTAPRTDDVEAKDAAVEISVVKEGFKPVKSLPASDNDVHLEEDIKVEPLCGCLAVVERAWGGRSLLMVVAQ